LRRKGILALAVVALLTVGVGVALAAKSYSTRIVFQDTFGEIQDLTVFGKLNTNAKCLGARQMALFKRTSGDEFKLVDVDLSSFNGAWAFRANLTGGPDLAIKVKKDTRKHGDVICKGNTITLTSNARSAYSKVR
jgi:hypothetical protein